MWVYIFIFLILLLGGLLLFFKIRGHYADKADYLKHEKNLLNTGFTISHTIKGSDGILLFDDLNRQIALYIPYAGFQAYPYKDLSSYKINDDHEMVTVYYRYGVEHRTQCNQLNLVISLNTLPFTNNLRLSFLKTPAVVHSDEYLRRLQEINRADLLLGKIIH